MFQRKGLREEALKYIKEYEIGVTGKGRLGLEIEKQKLFYP